MKPVNQAFIIVFTIVTLFIPASMFAADQKALMARLENLDAVQAVAIANDWRWTNKQITIYADAQAIAFKFPDGRVKKIPMPKDKMLVAIAPYINKTHT